MKKILLSTVAMAAMAAQAQNVTVVKHLENDRVGMIPADYTVDGKAMFYLKSDDSEFKIMDSSFGDVKTVSFPTKTFESYDIVYKGKFNYNRNYSDSYFYELPGEDQWTNDMPMNTEAEILAFWKEYGYGSDAKLMEWNADTMLVYNDVYESGNIREINCSYYLRSNPKRWNSCRAKWERIYTGEHEANGVKENVREEFYSLFTEMEYYDVKNTDDEYYNMPVSQTFFNTDESFEYLRPEYEVALNFSRYEDWYGTFVESYSPMMKAVSIVQDNGKVLATIRSSVGQSIRDLTVIKSYDGIYLLAREDESTVVYKWDNGTNGISRVKEMKTMRAYPNPARRSETVTVDVPENVQNGSLIVTNTAGVTLQTVKLNGQRQAAVSTARMTSGVYNVTLVSGGKRLQTSRIIVK